MHKLVLRTMAARSGHVRSLISSHKRLHVAMRTGYRRPWTWPHVSLARAVRQGSLKGCGPHPAAQPTRSGAKPCPARAGTTQRQELVAVRPAGRVP
jgi:hypothetical protein